MGFFFLAFADKDADRQRELITRIAPGRHGVMVFHDVYIGTRNGVQEGVVVCYNELMFQLNPTLRRSLLPAGVLLSLLPALTGCGTKAMTTAKAQDALSEAMRHAQVDPDDKQARQWADRAVAIAPNDSATYLGPSDPDPTGLLLSVAAVFGRVGDDPALADYMQQAVQKFPGDDRGYQILIDAQGRLGRTAERKANAAKLVPLLTKKLHTPGATNMEEMTLALAQAYWDAGDAVNGAATYQSAISAHPADPGGVQQFGLCLRRGEHKPAGSLERR